MGVLDGQPVDQAITNPAFINKNQDDVMPNMLGFSRALSGANIADIQAAVNKLYLASGASESTTGTAYVAPAGTISVGENYQNAISALAQKFDGATGHSHTGAPGDGPVIAGTGIGGVPLMGFIEQTSPFAIIGSSVDVTTEMFGKSPSTGSTIEGVLTVTPYNEVTLESASGGLYLDNGGNTVYGRLTQSGSNWIVSFYSNIMGSETPFAFSSAVTGSMYYQELFAPLDSTPVFSQDIALRNMNFPASGGGGGGGGGNIYTEIDMVEGATGAVTGFLVDSAQYHGFVGEYSIIRRSFTVTEYSTGLADAVYDSSINTNGGASSTTTFSADLADGDTLITGAFTTFNGITANRIAKVSDAGVLDGTFYSNIGTGGFNNTTLSAVQLSTTDIIVGGQFTSVGGNSVNRLVKLDSTGVVDTVTFIPNLGTGFNNAVLWVSEQANGQILAGGDFTSFNGNGCNRLVRLNSDGTEDTTFTGNLGTGFDGSVKQVFELASGKILVCGAFSNLNGSAVAPGMARLNSNGTLDTTFNTALGTGFNSIVYGAAEQSNTDLVVFGDFSQFNSTSHNFILRMSASAVVDGTFTTLLGTGFDGAIRGAAIQGDGKIIVVGEFLDFDGGLVGYVTRLLSTGAPDDEFLSNNTSGADSTVYSVCLKANLKINLAGTFTNVNGTTYNRSYQYDNVAAASYEKREVATFWGSYSPAASGWEISDPIGAFGPSGVVLSVSSPGTAGQVQYNASTALPGTILESKLRFMWRGL